MSRPVATIADLAVKCDIAEQFLDDSELGNDERLCEGGAGPWMNDILPRLLNDARELLGIPRLAPADTAPRGPDPILAAIDASRAIFLAFVKAITDGDGEDTPEIVEAGRLAMKKWRELLDTAPTTLAGASAFASYVAAHHRMLAEWGLADIGVATVAVNFRALCEPAAEEC